jgi:hypothetical protein
MPKFEVRVQRTYHEEWVDLEIEAATSSEAEEKALNEAKTDANLLFGAISDPYFEVTDIEPIEEEDNATDK